MMVFVFISDGWGSVSGGINCFNYDLAIACARVTRSDRRAKICCVVPELIHEQKDEMQQKGIIPITLSKTAFICEESVQLIFNNIKECPELKRIYPDKCNTFYIGHDIYTGNLSKQLAEEYGGWNIVFHHMDYSSYYLLGKHNVSKYMDKITQQESILCNADLICAVGPMLLQSAKDISRGEYNDKCIEVFPGLAAFDALQEPPVRFNPVVFGRVEKDNQAIKQIPLAIDAFAKAIAMDKDTPIIKNNPSLMVIGYDAENSDALAEEVTRLQDDAYRIANSMCNIVPYPYMNDRTKLGKLLRAASVAMMLSYHEGFGLVGYEAIAAGIPLILSRNTGLYMFLEREQLTHLVYPVHINGSNTPKGYSKDNLDTVARALRDIRQSESQYKKNALDLRNVLLSKKDRYSWDAVANNFIQNVLQRFEAELKSVTTAFYSPDEIKKLNEDLKEEMYRGIDFDVYSGKHVFVVKGKNALASLVTNLQKEFHRDYDTFIYNMQSGDDVGIAYSDFLNNCWTTFGKKDDINGPGFEYFLGKRLKKTILILDGFPVEFFHYFDYLFSILDGQTFDFYIFIIFESDISPQIRPYCRQIRLQGTTIKQEPIPVCLTAGQKLIIKVLAFRGKAGYSKRLIGYICNGINIYEACQEENKHLTGVEDSAEMESKLKELGLIEEYSEYSYQNAEIYLSTASALEVDNKSYALGLSILGRFYAKCYYRSCSRDQRLGWGYFSCKCFSSAVAIDNEIKDTIKADYELILHRIRKKSMDTSDYEPYLKVLQKFFDEYEKPDNPWLWYALIHCEAICCPSADTLDKVNHVLQIEYPNSEKNKRSGNALYIQLIRMAAELEDELGMSGSLDRLLKRIKTLAEDNPSGTVWGQCYLTIINLAAGQGDYKLADEYLEQYRKVESPDGIYPEMIALATATDLKIAKHVAGYKVDLTNILLDIGHAFRIAKNKLQDCRAQAWTVGLWGECQILLKDRCGEGNLRKSMSLRKVSGEKSKIYRNWLQRISTYPSLQPETEMLLKQEMDRTGMQVYAGPDF